MREGMVEIREEFYQRDGRLRYRISCGNATLYDSIAMHFFYNIAHPDPRGDDARSKGKVCVGGGSCLVTALVKEGPKAMVKWSSPCTTL